MVVGAINASGVRAAGGGARAFNGVGEMAECVIGARYWIRDIFATILPMIPGIMNGATRKQMISR